MTMACITKISYSVTAWMVVVLKKQVLWASNTHDYRFRYHRAALLAYRSQIIPRRSAPSCLFCLAKQDVSMDVGPQRS